ncbi:lipopolysaccharide heptosyltransferase I [Nautilia sp.]
MKIAILRLSAMGDIIHSAVVLEYLYRNGIKVDWIADKRFASVLDNSPYIENIIKVDFKNSPVNTLLTARRYKYDMVIDFQGLIKSALLARIMGKETVGCDGYHTKEKPALLFYSRKLKIRNHSMGRYKDMINEIFSLGITDEMLKNHSPYLFYKSDPPEGFFSENKKNIMFVVGASAEFKMLPSKTWIQLAKELGENIIIPYGNEREKNTAEHIASETGAKVLPKMSLDTLKAAVSRCDLVIGNDTGPTYIAWANNVPSVIIYGPVEANKVYENSITKFVKSTRNTNPVKINRNDFSIRKVKLKDILDAVEKLKY